MIDAKCPHCKTTLSVPESLAGKTETCPECGRAVKLPIGKTKPQPPNTTVRMKQCYMCKEFIRRDAMKCPFCHTDQILPIAILTGLILLVVVWVIVGC